jgi:hypothetical protein
VSQELVVITGAIRSVVATCRDLSHIYNETRLTRGAQLDQLRDELYFLQSQRNSEYLTAHALGNIERMIRVQRCIDSEALPDEAYVRCINHLYRLTDALDRSLNRLEQGLAGLSHV